ncbi:Xenobiotic-transporting ATPase / Multidrug resistance-associated protein [Spironucleus salmonicida]|uniref:Multidrug resistance-associated protein n=1 Tax=Spironucleus salmonicida TaxID=348837 RepID=V6LQ75_9EUKA|nr:Xenobiotic-transporting ATPase / Multidrug resistance-associated protein [Spironucleus salmonicida]|eukprot:EST46730.1 Multidrug resistance-associated protein [Spironucleus salmonicida]
MVDMLTFSWLSPLIKKIKKGQIMQPNDIGELDTAFKPVNTAGQIQKEWNLAIDKYNLNNKKTPGLLQVAIKANKKNFLFLIFIIPFISLCNVMSPLAVQNFTQYLTPTSFTDCDLLLSQTPVYQMIPYLTGLKKVIKQLYPYIILVFFAQYSSVILQGISFSSTIRAALKINSGLLDLLYNKILLLSDQARASSATGNLVNLLYTDTQKISMLIQFFPMIFQMPCDIIAYLIYLGVKIDPIAFVGLCAYLVVIPVMASIMGFVFSSQRKIMNLRDVRVKRATEILNGIKVVKLFALEDIQEKRLRNIRSQEIAMLFKFGLCMGLFMLIAQTTAPLMTCFAFAAMIGLDRFDISTAFTTLFLFQFLSMSIIMLPMVLTAYSDAMISGNRISTFMQLSEPDNGVVSRQDKQGANAIEIVNKPSFSWANKKDLYLPPILDPFFKENTKTVKTISTTLPKLIAKFTQMKSRLLPSIQTQNVLEIDLLELQNDPTAPPLSAAVLDRWCVDFDVTFLSRFENLQQYLPGKLDFERQDCDFDRLRKLYLHIQIINKLISKQNQAAIDDLPDVLHDLEIQIPHGKLYGVCGQVGCGKSSFFSAILGEMRLSSRKRDHVQELIEPPAHLTFAYKCEKQQQKERKMEAIFVKVSGSIAYFSQNPAVFNCTVRENITFGKAFDQQKYDKICEICCLVPDFAIMAAGDATEVGAKGVTLSGGQKARLALARAVYSDSDIYLLDDPLSAVDSHVGFTLWNEVVKGYLVGRGKTVVIASHQTHFFEDCDSIVNIIDGKLAHIGTLDELMAENVVIMGLTDHTKTSAQNVSQTEILEDKAVIHAPKRTEEVSPKDAIIENQADGKLTDDEKQSGNGNVSIQSYIKWLTAGSGMLFACSLFFQMISQALQQYMTILVTAWTQDEYNWSGTKDVTPVCEQVCPNSTCPPNNPVNPLISACNAFFQTDADTQTVFTCLASQSSGLPSFNLKTSPNYLYLYIGLTLLIMLFVYLGNVFFTKFCLDASQNLHNRMLRSILRQRTAFFDTTPQGRIQNRLSKDTDSVDSNILRYMSQGIMTLFMIIGMIITMSILNFPVLILIIPAIIIFLSIFISFRKVSPQLKRIDAILRSPVFSTCGETVDCLISIRSFQRKDDFLQRFRKDAEASLQANWLTLALQRWLTFRLGILCASFAFLVTIVCTLVAPYSMKIASYTGIIVSQSFSITYILLQFVTTLVQVESEMASVERIVEYQDMEEEGVYVTNTKKGWPQKSSKIEVKNLSFRYRSDLDLVVKNINFTIDPGEHIGIVGRTGAGKSSITVALFRLAECEKETQIIIDGVNIREIGLHTARQALTIIPQDPFLFSGTLRQCLCVFSQAEAEGIILDGVERIPDEKLWSVLDSVQMGDFFRQQPGQLNCKIAMNGDNLSAGQKQLVCVARALIKECCLVVLDEATAQVDRENDKLIQITLRDNLKGTAILSIAHRLDTIIDFDRIIVMDKGEIVEMDSPAKLLRQKGVFYEMVEKLGEEMSGKLKNAADLAEKQRQEGVEVRVEIDQ